MNKKNILLIAFFAIIVSFSALLSEVKAQAFNKQQTIINLTDYNVKFVNDNGEITTRSIKEGSIFSDENGVTYMDLKNIGDILNEDFFYEYDGTQNSITVFKNEDKQNKFMKINTESSIVNFYDNTNNNSYDIVYLNENLIFKGNDIFIPFRGVMNVLGYEDNEILFNSTLKTITLNQYPLFETGSVTITDTVHYPEHCPNTAEKCLTSYSTSDKKSIDYLVSVLNEEPFYESNVSIRSVYPNYKLNFNNGTIINVMSPTVCTITVNGKKTGTYQLTFKSSVAIETFIKENINLDSIVYDKWEYDLSDADDLYKKEYISCDYLGGDFSNVIKYLEANIEDFNSKYTYSIVSDKSGTKITVMSDEKTFSIRVYENPGAIRYTIDAVIGTLK